MDDEATILVEYPKAQGIIEASWNWPFSRKDFEVYGEKGYAIATGGNNLRVRLPGAAGRGVAHSGAPEARRSAIPSRTSPRWRAASSSPPV